MTADFGVWRRTTTDGGKMLKDLSAGDAADANNNNNNRFHFHSATRPSYKKSPNFQDATGTICHW